MPISRLSLLPALTLNQGPFPPPALPGFVGTTSLSAIPCGPARSSRTTGWARAHRAGLPVLRPVPYVCMPSPVPRQDRQRDWPFFRFPRPAADSSLP